MNQDSDSALAACESVEEFAHAASALGIALTAEQLAAAARPDPLGIALYGDAPANTADWPGPPWRPAHVSLGGAIAIDWVAFRAQRAVRLPQPGGAARHLGQAVQPAVPPPHDASGFHRRRPCGRAAEGLRLPHVAHRLDADGADAGRPARHARDLRASAGNDALFVAHSRAGLAPAQRSALLRAILAAYARDEHALIVHFDAWHAIMLPLIRAAFPGVPFEFLYRDPTEVLVSYARLGGGAFPARAMPQFW